jgi:hypothetical protein
MVPLTGVLCLRDVGSKRRRDQVECHSSDVAPENYSSTQRMVLVLQSRLMEIRDYVEVYPKDYGSKWRID